MERLPESEGPDDHPGNGEGLHDMGDDGELQEVVVGTSADEQDYRQKYLGDEVDAYEEYVEEEVIDDGQIDDDRILVDDDEMMEDEYEQLQQRGHGARSALIAQRGDISTLMSLSRRPQNARKTVREFLDDVGATEEVQSAAGHMGYDKYGGVRVHAPSRLLPVSTIQRVGPGNFVVQKHYQMPRVSDWRDEQRRDLEICEFFDSLPGDRQIAFRKMLERLGERIPKPLMGSRKYFRSTLAPHVKIPIPSNSKLELLSDQAMNRVRAEAGGETMTGGPKPITKENEYVRDMGEAFYIDNRKIYVYNNEEYEEKSYGGMANASFGEVVSEEVIEEEILENGQLSGKPNLDGDQSEDGGDGEGPPPIEPQEPLPAEIMPPGLQGLDHMGSPLGRDHRMSDIIETRHLKNRWFVVPELRKDLIGQTHVKVSRGNIEPHNTFFCDSCSEYMPRNAYETHLRKINRWGTCDHYTPRRFPCTEKDCNQRLPSIEKLCTHLRISHKVPLDIKEKTFANEEQFQVFLRELEGKGGNFRMSRGNKSSREGVQIRYYRCNRNVRMQPGKKIITASGAVVRPGVSAVDNLMEEVEEIEYDEDETGVPKTTRKKPSKLFIHGMCTAFFKKLEFQDGRIHVRYCDYHLHPDAVLRIPDDVRDRIKELNLKRLPVPVIIKVVKTEVHNFAEEGSALEERILNINDKDVRNVLSRCGLKPIRLQICRNKTFAERDDLEEQLALERSNPNRHVQHHIGTALDYDDGVKQLQPPEPHEMFVDHETMQREDELLDIAVNDPAMVDPNRPPSPEGLTQLERACYESWQQEDIETVNEAAEKRREAIQLRRRRETVQDEFEECSARLKLEFFNALNEGQVRRVRSMIDELSEMYNETAGERHKGLLRSNRRGRKSSPQQMNRRRRRYKFEDDQYGDEPNDINLDDEPRVEVEEVEIHNGDEQNLMKKVPIMVPQMQHPVIAPPHRVAARRSPQKQTTHKEPMNLEEAPPALEQMQEPGEIIAEEYEEMLTEEILQVDAEMIQEGDEMIKEMPEVDVTVSPRKRNERSAPIAAASEKLATPSISGAGRRRKRTQESLIEEPAQSAEIKPEQAENVKRRGRKRASEKEPSPVEVVDPVGEDVAEEEPQPDAPHTSSAAKKQRQRRSQNVEKSYDYTPAMHGIAVSRSGRRVNKTKLLDM
ncbi:unnamed protein product, partial [Mesorhabditis belari]|uniref:C2H2-type domain-containing protein n=1 Tax=Mesorhabditis belari TaxID=2138241 RepID=A0AAF3JA77_9BILA